MNMKVLLEWDKNGLLEEKDKDFSKRKRMIAEPSSNRPTTRLSVSNSSTENPSKYKKSIAKKIIVIKVRASLAVLSEEAHI